MPCRLNPLTFVGNTIRDSLLMPDPKKKFSDEIFQDCQNVLDRSIPDSNFYPNKKAVLDLFEIKEEWIEHRVGDKQFRTKVCIFETKFKHAKETHNCVRVGGADELVSLSSVRVMPFLSAFQNETDQKTNLRIIQVSLFENQEGEEFKDWKPAQFDEMGKVFFSFLKALKS